MNSDPYPEIGFVLGGSTMGSCNLNDRLAIIDILDATPLSIVNEQLQSAMVGWVYHLGISA